MEYAPEFQFEQLRLGCEKLFPENELMDKLKKSYQENKPLKIKFGADPTRPDIHLGHTVVINKLKLLQDFGHEIYFLIGDFTATIGDPSGKNKSRPTLTVDQVNENAKTYTDQIFKIMDREKTKVVFNSSWFNKFTARDFITLISKSTVQQIMDRNDFDKRSKSGNPIFLNEIIYPLLQGYDSVVLEADIELGGTDQEFNLLMGRSIQKSYGKEQQCILCMPILEGLDGIEKMSKSADNYIGLNESSKDMFGKVMSIPDSVMIKYYRLLSRLSAEEVLEIEKNIANGSLHPIEAKKNLAELIVSHYFGLEVAASEKEYFNRVFSKKEIPDDIKVVEIENCVSINIIDLCLNHGLIESKSEARRLMAQGAIRINDKKIEGAMVDLDSGKEYVLKVGKRRIIKIVVKG
jgi:tyrosyl-tRNA synthetase